MSVPVNLTTLEAVTGKLRLLTVICVPAGLVEAVPEKSRKGSGLRPTMLMPSPLITPPTWWAPKPLPAGKVSVPFKENEPSELGRVYWVSVSVAWPLSLWVEAVRVPV